MKKIIKALSTLIKNIHIKCTSKCCACDSDCNKPIVEEAVDVIVEEAVEAIVDAIESTTKITTV